MAVGKIASSTANYSTLGKTSPKNFANGFIRSRWNDPFQFQNCEVFAPSLNLGVSVINTVIPATQGYKSYTQGPGIEGGVGYAPTFTENNITIVKPNSLPTNPAFEDGRSFDRYETSMLDMARGLSTSVVIGSDWFTVQDFYQGGLNTPNGYFIGFGNSNADGQVLIGMQNFQGVGATSAGYAPGEIYGNVIVGSHNGNRPLRTDGNFAYLYPDYGYTLGYESQVRGITLLGNNNINGLLRGTGNNANINYSNFVIVGYSNYNLPQEKWEVGGYGQRQRIESPGGNSITIGYGNVPGYLSHINNWTGTPFEMPQIRHSDILIGRGSYRSRMFDFANPEDPFPFAGYQINFKNTIIGQVGHFRERLEISPGWTGYTNRVLGNVVMNTGYNGGPATSMAQHNIMIGDRIAVNNQMGADSSGGGWSNMLGNILIGQEVLDQHGTYNTETNTNYNTIIGTRAQTQSTGLTNCTIIGHEAIATATNASNEITLGNSSISALRCNVTSITSLSDARDKTNIEPISNASAFIKDLKPVKFDWNRRDGVKAKEHDIGFLAQDLDEAQSKHGIQEHLDIVYKSNPEALEASYGKLLPILVQALKEQQEEIEKLKSTN